MGRLDYTRSKNEHAKPLSLGTAPSKKLILLSSTFRGIVSSGFFLLIAPLFWTVTAFLERFVELLMLLLLLLAGHTHGHFHLS